MAARRRQRPRQLLPGARTSGRCCATRTARSTATPRTSTSSSSPGTSPATTPRGERAALLLIDVGRPAPALLYISIPNTHAELYGVIDRVLGRRRRACERSAPTAPDGRRPVDAVTATGRLTVTTAGAELTLRHPVERFTLDNGLRVVLAPDRSVPVVAVSVFYDVGMRNEPEGRTGFAHLFEHMMFQGSANVPKMEHARLVQAAGGTFNGSTHQDYTNYFEALPAEALERALFLEADRMAAPAITEENLRNQIDVVKEEIRVNVLNRPYGAFPWLQLPQIAFESFANTHDGYGSFVDLESSTVDDADRLLLPLLRPGQRRPLHRRRPRRRRDRAAGPALVRPGRRPRRCRPSR